LCYKTKLEVHASFEGCTFHDNIANDTSVSPLSTVMAISGCHLSLSDTVMFQNVVNAKIWAPTDVSFITLQSSTSKGPQNWQILSSSLYDLRGSSAIIMTSKFSKQALKLYNTLILGNPSVHTDRWYDGPSRFDSLRCLGEVAVKVKGNVQPQETSRDCNYAFTPLELSPMSVASTKGFLSPDHFFYFLVHLYKHCIAMVVHLTTNSEHRYHVQLKRSVIGLLVDTADQHYPTPDSSRLKIVSDSSGEIHTSLWWNSTTYGTLFMSGTSYWLAVYQPQRLDHTSFTLTVTLKNSTVWIPHCIVSSPTKWLLTGQKAVITVHLLDEWKECAEPPYTNITIFSHSHNIHQLVQNNDMSFIYSAEDASFPDII
jgi:hypothetical protein